MNVSKNITLKEATRSNTAIKKGIDNTPNQIQLQAMKNVAEKVFQPVREHFGQPIRINSFFRSPELNKIIGGSTTSQHCKGEAMDLDALNGITNKQIFDFIRENLEFDQLLWEYGDDENPDWVHVSLCLFDENRKQVLRVVRENGKAKYLPWD